MVASTIFKLATELVNKSHEKGDKLQQGVKPLFDNKPKAIERNRKVYLRVATIFLQNTWNTIAKKIDASNVGNLVILLEPVLTRAAKKDNPQASMILSK